VLRLGLRGMGARLGARGSAASREETHERQRSKRQGTPMSHSSELRGNFVERVPSRLSKAVRKTATPTEPAWPLWSAPPSRRLERSRIRHNFVTLLSVVVSERIATLSPRTMTQLFTLHRKRGHSHRAVRTYVLGQRLGVPYEVERTLCADCRQVLEERPLKRAAA